MNFSQPCPRQPRRTACWWIALAAVSLLPAGCGYSHTELYPQEFRTVSVPIFENRTTYRAMEFDLTEALVKEIELRTPYKVVRSGDADTILTGTVITVEQRLLSQSAIGGLPQEIELTVVVNFEWKDARAGQVIRNRKGFASVGRHVPARSPGPPGSGGELFDIAQHQAVQQMAKDIVTTMQAGW